MRRLLLLLPLLLLFDIANARSYEDVHFFNPDGTRNVYFCDTVSMTDYVVVRTAKTGHKFLISDSSYQIEEQGFRYWDSTYAFCYIEDLYDVVYFDCMHEDVIDYWEKFEYWPEKRNRFQTKWKDQDKDVVCSFRHKKPTLFLLFFVRGDAINYITFHNWMDGCPTSGPLDFTNPYAFYPVYIPYQ